MKMQRKLQNQWEFLVVSFMLKRWKNLLIVTKEKASQKSIMKYISKIESININNLRELTKNDT